LGAIMAKGKPAGRKLGRIILLSSPKGGTGKSSLARNLLVSAAKDGSHVLGVDFDRQQTLTKWANRRERVRQSFPEMVHVGVKAASLGDWRSIIDAAPDFDLVVIDTAPSIEDHYNAALGLSAAANFVLVPVGQTQDDIDSASPWMQTLTKAGIRAAFVLNRANRRTRSYDEARAKLLKVGPLCPVEIPTLEDIHVTAGKGLSILDVKGAKASDTFAALWSYVAREAGVTMEAAA
jgi:chromosome partitioning protein